jgi:hypothetical protein
VDGGSRLLVHYWAVYRHCTRGTRRLSHGAARPILKCWRQTSDKTLGLGPEEGARDRGSGGGIKIRAKIA